jgi:hypothetical protein
MTRATHSQIRDKSRSVNSIDVVFNFDCLGPINTVVLLLDCCYTIVRFCIFEYF